MTDRRRECYYRAPDGEECRMPFGATAGGPGCVAGLSALIRRLEASAASTSLAPGLAKARELLLEMARVAAEATADRLMYAIRAGSGPERETATRLTEECAIRRAALLSAVDAIDERTEDAE